MAFMAGVTRRADLKKLLATGAQWTDNASFRGALCRFLSLEEQGGMQLLTLTLTR